ncbi:MAG: glycosyl transferase [Ferrovibrio sp.]|nr:glycosyl transferase [Ferrovibrio sp.]
MHSLFHKILQHRRPSPPWNSTAPVREELFGIERLEQHAASLANTQPITNTPIRVFSLHKRLDDNAAVLLAAYLSSARELESGRDVVPASEWLLDNYHLVEEQIREIRDDLPPGYYRQLPKLADGPFAGYPRVFGIAWAFIAHTDSHFDPEILRRFIVAYQRVQPLTIGELWAVAITLRIVLIENLRRLTDQITSGREARADADALADRLLVPGNARTALEADIASRDASPLSERFAAQLAKRLRDQDPHEMPALAWLEERLKRQGETIDDAVQHAQQRQGASNVTVRNVITSMRLISDIDWAALFESVSLVDERLCASGGFAAMDFPTRNLYRSAIEQLSRGSQATELEITDQALEAAQAKPIPVAGGVEAERSADPGYHLIAGGRRAFEKKVGFKPALHLRLKRCIADPGIKGYVAAILLVTSLILAAALWLLWSDGIGLGWLVAFTFAGIIPATELAVALVNRSMAWCFGPAMLPGLDLATGVPSAFRTLVVVPTLLTSEADLIEQIERLEVHHLSGVDGDLSFALLTDGIDADQEIMPADTPLLAVAAAAIAQLNQRHAAAPGGERFLLLHRRRLFNAGENKWMGWERKRGKLHELNRLLRGATDTSFVAINGQEPTVPADVRYVITLDADTRLPRDAARRLVGKMAHPLNRPRFNMAEQRVVDGYAILQPRVTPSLPIGRDGSLYQRIFSGPSGMDPYAAAVSDVYQDLLGEGTFTGKGIYDVDAFAAALAGRVPENTMLSHDLFEGVFARAGLVSDIEVVEDFPSRYDVAAKRRHRWSRGDWQLLPWIFGRQPLPAIGRWKMLDNLRRSLQAPCMLLALGICSLLPQSVGLTGMLLVLSTIAIPIFLPTAFAILPHRTGMRLRNHVDMLAGDLHDAVLQAFFSISFLADQAWRMGDAIIRTLFRLFLSKRHLLEWTTAAQTAVAPRLNGLGFYRAMAGGVFLAILALLTATPVFWPLILLWLAAPALALWASLPPKPAAHRALSADDARDLRLIARLTWRYFEIFVTPADNMLPPDNFQEDPKPVVAHRTSPTNIGLYLLSAITARDFGWAGMVETVERLEASFITMRKMPRFKGHFFNWYGTRDLAVLSPAYVSSVDSGNLAGHLIVVANSCEEWANLTPSNNLKQGFLDTLQLAREALDVLPNRGGEVHWHLAATLMKIETLLNNDQAFDGQLAQLHQLVTEAVAASMTVAPDHADLVFWVAALQHRLAEHERDRLQHTSATDNLAGRLQALADSAREMALAMDFAFLLDPERKLLSIGFSHADYALDPSCYDLLASEARLASLFAIAKGDAATKHWFRLGRAATPLGIGSALISWSGSMFEYLMPSLVMRAPIGSLLEQTSCLVVQRQKEYGLKHGMPWGISESAYNARDLEYTYQYSNFGVPGLGLKRGLADNMVIAPYATGLAAMVAPKAARQNYARLASIGARGRYGFYEALDFTRSRLPDNTDFAIVRSFMAHHQGMTIVAIANALQDGLMRSRFHREPMIQAAELLLQERMPRNVALAHPRAEEVKGTVVVLDSATTTQRHLTTPMNGPPVSHLLSNGRYTVMLTATGAGYSHWNDIAVTRWREDASRDNCGSFIFLRDTQSGQIWSASGQPIGSAADHSEVIFAEDHAEFIRSDGQLTTILEILVSGEDDGEVRRVSLTNNSRQARNIELTSYAELVLAPPAADAAHPAFSKLFVQTDYLAEFGAVTATRRPRSQDEPAIWAAHFAVVEGTIIAEPQYESDRSRFLERGRDIGNAAAIMQSRPLSGSIGTVLDPIFSLRYQLTVPPGGITRIAFWTVAAASQAELLAQIDKHQDRNAFERAKTLAWTQAQVQLRHLDIEPEEAADFQRLAAPILYADARFRAASDTIQRGAGLQSALWRHGISGDMPIVLLRIDEIEDIAQVRQLLRAHEYWRMKGLGVDLVIINERASSYTQDLQIAIETAVRSGQSQPHFSKAYGKGAVFALRADLISAETRALLQSVARIAFKARHGPIASQLSRIPPATTKPVRFRPARPLPPPSPPAQPSGLEFFNGLGGFDQEGREYVIILNAGQTTPAPWINVIANPGFGFQVSAEGSGYSWAENSRENQLSPWSNDPVSDPSGETIYIRDEISADLWCATARPIQDGGSFVIRHGYGYSRFEHQAHGIATELLQYVPLADPVKISRLTLRNLSGRPRRLSVTAYAEWVLGTARGASGPFIITGMDEATGAMLAHNPWNIAFPGRTGFADLGGQQSAWTADRTEFLGRNGNAAAPAALLGKTVLSGQTGAGLDPCAALQQMIELGVGETIEVVFLLGQGGSAEQARTLITRYRAANLDTVLTEVTEYWQALVGCIQVKTPDRAMDIMLNGWLLYQTLACRIWARAAFYQASGAYGFRDQLQDGMALTFTMPQETRHHILRAAARQFIAGDVQHWWLPHSGQGVRTHISDDRVWLAFATATYINATNDSAILDECVPFLDGPALHADEHDAFFQPMTADVSATLFEHCARALDQCLDLTGAQGLPLIGTGDWNDGMNRVGAGGKGESVWLGWLLLRTIALFAPFAADRDAARMARWQAHATALQQAIEREAWDGAWYRRATYDDGSWLGSQHSEACRIDSIAQSWAVLSGAADPARAAMAMVSLDKHLVRHADGLALLFTPAFEQNSLHDPGYIKGYPPGLRENGGQYSHAAMWAILAFAKLGNGDRAAELFALINPINHARTATEAARYKVEPYVVAADVYSEAPHVGRGGWTWYTGSAGWMYRAGIEGILGIRREGDSLIVAPCLPQAWPGFTAVVNLASTRCSITVTASGQDRGSMQATLDGLPLTGIAAGARIPLDGRVHELRITF